MGRFKRVIVAGLTAGVLTSGAAGAVLAGPASAATSAPAATALRAKHHCHGHHAKAAARACKAKRPVAK